MRSMIAISIVAISTVTAVGVRAAQDNYSSPKVHVGAAVPAPQQAPQNLQVLPKDWTTQQVTTVMRTFTAGLGVQCTYCHVQDRSSDEMKTKQTARKMLTMSMAINDTFLKDIGEPPAAGAHKVTCYTCHRGTTKPLTAPPAAGGGHSF
jgi:hypothetical protein